MAEGAGLQICFEEGGDVGQAQACWPWERGSACACAAASACLRGLSEVGPECGSDGEFAADDGVVEAEDFVCRVFGVGLEDGVVQFGGV